MPYTPPATDHPDPQEEHRERARRNAARYRAARDNRPAPIEPAPHSPDPHEEHQVRLTAQRLLTTHLQPTAEHHWAGISLDLTGATLTDFTVINCTVNHADFSYTTFSGKAWFNEAAFSGDAGFNGATFSGNAWFDEATFSGNVVFREARFEVGVEMTSATVADAASEHVPPPGWRIEATEGGAGRFDLTPAPANDP